MSDMPLRTLVLAGTAESRALIHALSDEPSVQLTASLAGATPNPARLPVPTRVGGFGGPEGLVEYCRDNGVGLMIDATHPLCPPDHPQRPRCGGVPEHPVPAAGTSAMASGGGR